MKKLVKFVFRLALWLIALVAVLALFRNVIAEALLRRRLHAETGMEVSIGRVRLGLKDPTFTIQDLRMYNTDDFGRTSCLDVPELFIEYDLHALLSKRIHLKLVRLDLAELHIVQNDEGKINIDSLQVWRRTDASNRGAQRVGFEEIETLSLTLGRFKYSNLKTPSENDELFAGVRNQVVHHVKSAKDLEPLLTRIALERNAKHFFDRCFNRGSNPPQKAATSPATDSSPITNAPEPAPPGNP